MTSKSVCLLLLIFIFILNGLLGCQNVQKTLVDTIVTEPSDEDIFIDSTPIKVISLINLQEDGRDAYISWTESTGSVWQAPQELVRIRAYTNEDPTVNPNLLIEFEFANFADASKYMSRPEIAEIMNENMNYITNSTVHTFIERSAYSRTGEDNHPLMGVYFVNYLLGGRQSYLDWRSAIRADVISSIPQLKSLYTYENYYGGSPHRLVELGFSSREDVDRYLRENLSNRAEELDVRTSSWTFHVFELRSVIPNP